jgi:hypothetical protein
MKIELSVGPKKYQFSGPKNWNETEPACYEKVFEVGRKLVEKPHALFLLPQVLYRIPVEVLQFLYDRNAMRTVGVKDERAQEQVLEQGQALLQIAQLFANSDAPNLWKVEKLKASFLGRNYYGPGDELGKLTFEEFWFAESAYENNDADRLIGILYRKDPYRKQEFSDEVTEATMADLRSLPELTKEMIMFNYQGCRLGFAKRYKHVFPKKKALEEGNTEKPKKQKGGWLKVAIGMANDSSVEFEALRKKNIFVALQMLDNRLLKVKELKAKK